MIDDGWKTLANLANTWSSVVLSIDHQYYEYMQVYELIGVRKAALCKQCRSRKYRPAFGRHSLINKLKKDNEADKPGTEAAVASTSFPLDAPFLSGKSSTTRNHSSTGNAKQFEQICFICNKIRPCDCSAYNDDEWEFVNSKVQEIDWWMLRMRLPKQNTVDLVTENGKIWMW